MSTLEYTIYGIKRGWRVSRTFLFAGAFSAMMVNGAFSQLHSGDGGRILPILLFVVWGLFFGLKVHARFLKEGGAGALSAGRSDLEIGLLLIIAMYAVIQIAGGLSSPYYPALLILVAFLVVYTPHWIGFTLVAATIGLEFAVVSKQPSADGYWQAMLHAGYIILFAFINLIFTRTEMMRIRGKALKHIEQAKAQIASDARAFRLTSATRQTADAVALAEEQERLTRCTVAEVRRSMYHHIQLLHQTLGLHTCALFWLDEDGRTLQILECVSRAETISRRAYRPREGIMGAIVQNADAISLSDLRPGHSGLVYYTEPTRVTDFLGIPVLENKTLRGVLIGDRTDNRPFSEAEKDIFSSAVESILRTVENERVFVQLQKAKSEQGRLLLASESLSRALNRDDVVSAALEAAALIAPYDMAAVALSKEDGRQHIVEARGQNATILQGLTLSKRTGLAASVERTGHYLPYRGNFDPGSQTVYTRGVQKAFSQMRSLLVLPLLSGDQGLGTLMLGSVRRGAYCDEIRNALQVMINQLGVKLQNAEMIQRLKEMATMDGLTGLANRRAFQDELARQMAHSTRFNTQTSVILCDVDKFKDVNDTFGHGVGDDVLRALGETLRRIVIRDTDMPARYGGEEFVIICGGTDTAGAVQLGERIRQDLENQVFQTEKGELRCTISMGVATFPDHSRTADELLERADQALYVAKEGGRNQVRVWKKSS